MKSSRQALLLLAMLVGAQTDAASAQQVQLTGDTVGTPAPYREAVRRYLLRQEPKIVGGKKAPEGAFPWQVSLGVAWISDPYYAHFCGGSIYNRTWIVTAAHCVEDLTPEKVTITAGTNALGIGGARVNARRIIVRTDYQSTTFDNDIALIELFNPLPSAERITAISLLEEPAAGSLLRDEAPLVVLGWGAQREGGSTVRDLRYADVFFIPRADCNDPLSYGGRVTDNMLCAGVPAGNVDSCQGDSGGPLVVRSEGGIRLAGIVSWGEGCARPNKYGVYTSVSTYNAWVADCVARPEQCN